MPSYDVISNSHFREISKFIFLQYFQENLYFQFCFGMHFFSISFIVTTKGKPENLIDKIPEWNQYEVTCCQYDLLFPSSMTYFIL